MRMKTFFLISILLTSARFGFAYYNNPSQDITFEKKFSSFYNKLKPIVSDLIVFYALSEIMALTSRIDYSDNRHRQFFIFVL